MYSLALFGGLVCFLFLCLFLFWLLAPLCIRPIYSLGHLVLFFLLNISAQFIHKKKCGEFYNHNNVLCWTWNLEVGF